MVLIILLYLVGYALSLSMMFGTFGMDNFWKETNLVDLHKLTSDKVYKTQVRFFMKISLLSWIWVGTLLLSQVMSGAKMGLGWPSFKRALAGLKGFLVALVLRIQALSLLVYTCYIVGDIILSIKPHYNSAMLGLLIATTILNSVVFFICMKMPKEDSLSIQFNFDINII